MEKIKMRIGDISNMDRSFTKLVTPAEKHKSTFSFSLKPQPIADASEHGDGFP